MSEAQEFERIKNHFFKPENENRSEVKPRMIFCFSSPGAGKTTSIKPILLESFNEHKPVVLEIDELKAFMENPLDTNRVKQHFLNCLQKAFEEKRSLIIFRQRNMLEPNLTKSIFNDAKANGYETQVTFLALDKKRSRLGMIYRYENALKKAVESKEMDIANYPRKPEFMKHYIFFKMIPIVAAACNKSKNIDIINVYDREGSLLAENNRINKTKIGNGIVNAIYRERHRKWTDLEADKFNRRRNEAENSMAARASNLMEKIKFKLFTRAFNR